MKLQRLLRRWGFNKMIKAILFDIDNTLLDFMKMKTKSCEKAVDAMIKAGLKTNKKKTLKVLYELYDKYGIEYQRIFEKLTKELTGKINYKLISYGVVAYRKEKQEQLVPYKNVIPTLKALKKNLAKEKCVEEKIIEKVNYKY
jgi:FMN phosphatase YigB (HAD superfamily)